jgi:hypothetical protein
MKVVTSLFKRFIERFNNPRVASLSVETCKRLFYDLRDTREGANIKETQFTLKTGVRRLPCVAVPCQKILFSDRGSQQPISRFFPPFLPRKEALSAAMPHRRDKMNMPLLIADHFSELDSNIVFLYV